MSDWVLILAIAGAWALIGRRWAAPKPSAPSVAPDKPRPIMPWEIDDLAPHRWEKTEAGVRKIYTADVDDSEVVVGLPNRSLTVTMREPADNRLTLWCDSNDDMADHYAGRCKCIPTATAAKIAAAGMSLFPRR